MGLLEFIFENPLIMLIIIGALSTLFGRKKQEEQQRQRRQQQQRQQQASTDRQESHPQYDDEQTVELPWEQYPEELEEMYNTESSTSSRQGTDRDSRSRENRNEPRYEQASSTAPVTSTAIDRTIGELYSRENRIREPIHTLENQIQNVTYSEDVNKLMDFKRINSQNIVQGVIWSEVLGAPRARNPHRTQGYLYRQRRVR